MVAIIKSSQKNQNLISAFLHTNPISLREILVNAKNYHWPNFQSENPLNLKNYNKLDPFMNTNCPSNPGLKKNIDIDPLQSALSYLDCVLYYFSILSSLYNYSACL